MDTLRTFLVSLSGEYLLGALLGLSGALTVWALVLHILDAVRERRQAKAVQAHFEAMLNHPQPYGRDHD